MYLYTTDNRDIYNRTEGREERGEGKREMERERERETRRREGERDMDSTFSLLLSICTGV